MIAGGILWTYMRLKEVNIEHTILWEIIVKRNDYSQQDQKCNPYIDENCLFRDWLNPTNYI